MSKRNKSRRARSRAKRAEDSTKPLNEADTLTKLSERLKALEASARQGGPAFWGAQCVLPFEQTVVASLLREVEVLMLFLAAQHLLIRDLRDAVQPRAQIH
jgi:hypothetical protein